MLFAFVPRLTATILLVLLLMRSKRQSEPNCSSCFRGFCRNLAHDEVRPIGCCEGVPLVFESMAGLFVPV